MSELVHKPSRKLVLILYRSLAAYFVACCKAMQNKADVHVVYWPSKGSAPFQFEDFSGVQLYERANFNDKELLRFAINLNPDVVVCCGWKDKVYLEICKKYKGVIPTVLTADNHWKNTTKQKLFSIMSPFYLKKRFSHIWIPGSPQQEFAQKIGFRSNEIIEGYYSADVDEFDKIYEDRSPQTPGRFLFLGRYVDVKGIDTLWKAYDMYKARNGSWELWCVGTGDQWESRSMAKGIKHFGFLQPNEMKDVVNQCTTYILPSHFEPWAVSVQEMAVSGLSLLLSTQVGARTQFLEAGANGFEFDSRNPEELCDLMLKMSQKSEEELLEMSQLSRRKGISYNPSDWSNKILGLVELEESYE